MQAFISVRQILVFMGICQIVYTLNLSYIKTKKNIALISCYLNFKGSKKLISKARHYEWKLVFSVYQVKVMGLPW